MEELPLGANGKVDREALPPPDERVAERILIPPGNPVEEKLVRIWRQILDVPRLSVDDNFFHLGGESLRATRAVSQMNLEFKCRLTLPRLFEAPTVRQMAKLVQNAQEASDGAPLKSRSKAAAPLIGGDVSNLSEGEVDDLLNQLLATHDGSN
jgi:hypothetical protein